MIICFILVTCLVSTFVGSFNLDTGNTKWILNGPPNSNFGFSLSMHVGNSESSVIVGAPDQPQPTGGTRRGGVYSCSANNSCALLSNKLTTPSDSMTNPGTGFSVTSQSGSLLTCSPRWSQEASVGGRNFNMFRGECILSMGDLNNQSRVVQACNIGTARSLKFNIGFGVCTSGFSSTASRQPSQQPLYFVSAPGAVRYTGRVYGIFGTLQDTAISVNIGGRDRSSFFGYSLSWGILRRSSRFGELVVGAPRDNRMMGRVAVIRIDGGNGFRDFLSGASEVTTTGLQVGAYFGASVCAVDVNNDGLDDVIVGAPRFSIRRDEGKAYVFMNQRSQGELSLLNRLELSGESKISAFFGTSIARLGDVNRDGFQDIAISAPGSDYAENGAVYIYSGSKDGLLSKPSQIIRASDVPQRYRQGFGYALSGEVDIDGNTYPDLAIGAHRSNSAFLFRSNPVASLKDNVKFNVSFVPFKISCDGPDGNKYQCVEMEVSLEYSGDGIEDSLEIEITYTLDFGNIFPRVFMQNNNTNTLASKSSREYTLLKNRRNPYFVLLYFQVNILTDVTTSMQVLLNYKLMNSNCGNNPCPVLDQFAAISNLKEISYLRNCGDDEECNPDLVLEKLTIALPNSNQQKDIIYGTARTPEVFVSTIVVNKGEAGYQANMKFNFSSDFVVNAVEVNQRAVQFSNPIDIDIMTQQVAFPFANPIESSTPVSVIVKMTYPRDTPSVREYLFAMEAFSGGKEVNATDNMASDKIGTKIETCVRSSGVTNEGRIVYSLDAKQPPQGASINDLGPEVIYDYSVVNAGRFPLENLIATATMNLKKDNLQILYVVSVTVDQQTCPGNDVNPNKYIVPSVTTPTVTTPTNGTGGPSVRKRRDTANVAASQKQNNSPNCQGDGCQSYTCRISRILPQGRVVVQVKARIWAANAVEASLRPIDLISDFNVVFNGSNKDINVQGKDCNMETTVKYVISPSVIRSSSGSTSDWWLLFAIIGGFSILAIIVATLYKSGFYRRYQPLHGDEEGSEVPATGTVEKQTPEKEDVDDDEEK